MKKRNLASKPTLLISICVVLIDQASKVLARHYLTNGVPKGFIPDLIQIRLIKNTGAAFSIFSNSTLLLGILSFAVSILLIIWILQSSPLPLIQALGGALLLGGTIGNGIDRWFQGGVTDFLELVPISFPIFNIADIAINIAIICFGINALMERRSETRT